MNGGTSTEIPGAKSPATSCTGTTRPRTDGLCCLSTRAPPPAFTLATREAEMATPRCAQCHGKLGLGVKFGNLWNGDWREHFRFCSNCCQELWELERRKITAQNRWFSRRKAIRGSSS